MTRPAISALLLVGLAATLSSCINGMFLGLIPIGSSLDGEIVGDIYTSPDGSFSVAVPHADDDYERRHMQTKEQLGDNDAYVSFGPAAFDQSIYRITISRPPTPDTPMPDLMEAADRLIANFGAQLRDGFAAELEVKTPLTRETVAGQPAVHATLTQRVPAGKFNSDQDTPFTHEVWMIGFRNGIASAWVQLPESSGGYGGERLTPRAFAESIALR